MLTLDSVIVDLEIARHQELRVLRQFRILLLTEKSCDQGGLLTKEDLSRLLHVSSRTIRYVINKLIKDGKWVTLVVMFIILIVEAVTRRM